jgi:hypothetical protein
MASSGNGSGKHRSHSECAGATEGGTAVLWRLIRVDGRSVIHPSLRGGAIRCAVAPYELLDRYRSDPAWFLQGGARQGQALPCGCYFSHSRRSAAIRELISRTPACRSAHAGYLLHASYRPAGHALRSSRERQPQGRRGSRSQPKY